MLDVIRCTYTRPMPTLILLIIIVMMIITAIIIILIHTITTAFFHASGGHNARFYGLGHSQPTRGTYRLCPRVGTQNRERRPPGNAPVWLQGSVLQSSTSTMKLHKAINR